jgi:phospholipid/cholesterol/gamma-HCH transport system substrate-binding protein
MNERTKQFRVGLVVLFTFMAASLLVVLHTDFRRLPLHPSYQVKMLVDQAPGVGTNTPVRRRGIPIGRVASVEDADNGALITLDIDRDKTIKSNEAGRIMTTLVGDATIEFGPVSSPLGAEPVKPGETIKGMYAPNPMDLMANMQGDLKQTIVSLGDAGREVAELADRINQVLGENDMQRVTRVLDSMDQALVQFSTVTKNLNDIVGDETFKKNLKDGLGQLPGLATDARAIMQALQSVANSADENLKNLQGLTGPLGNRGTAIVGSLEHAVRNLEDLLGQVASLSRNVNNSEGTIGLLIRDRQAYDQLQATLVQAQAAIADVRNIVGTEKFRRRVEMILDNVWALTDKLQRDPARVIRGAAKPETPINVFQR